MDKVKFIVDIDKKKQGQYLQIVNKKIISPNKLCKQLKKNDVIIVSNSNYLKEVKNYLNNKLKFKANCIPLD